MPLDTGSLRGLASTLSAEAFASQVTSLFFLAAIDGSEVRNYETIAVGASLPRVPALETPTTPGTPSSAVMELAKAEGNPYPDRISIGRARNCDIVLRHASVSKLHAHVRIQPDGLALVDLDSHNGTRVNGEKLEAGQPRRVSAGDVVSFGRVEGRIADAAALYAMLRG